MVHLCYISHQINFNQTVYLMVHLCYISHQINFNQNCNALTKHERVTFLWDTNWSWNIWNCYISSNLSTAIPIPVWSSLRSRKLSQWLTIYWYWPLLLLLHQTQHCTCNTFCEKPNVTRASMFNKSYYKIMAICGQSLLNAYQWTYYIIIIFYWK